MNVAQIELTNLGRMCLLQDLYFIDLVVMVWAFAKTRAQRRCELDTTRSVRRRGRPRKTWKQQIREDMSEVDIAPYRTEWKRRTRPTPCRKG